MEAESEWSGDGRDASKAEGMRMSRVWCFLDLWWKGGDAGEALLQRAHHSVSA